MNKAVLKSKLTKPKSILLLLDLKDQKRFNPKIKKSRSA